MTMLKQEIDMIKFAFENGFTNYEKSIQANSDVAYTGSWGTFVVGKIEALMIDLVINHLLSTVEVEEKEEIQEVTIEEVEKVEVDEIEGLTILEKKVLNAIVKESYEYGLGIETSDLDLDIKGKSLSGVISSLSKKGYVEGYLDGKCVGYDNFFNLTEEWFNKLI